jgi:hypothetical protein
MHSLNINFKGVSSSTDLNNPKKKSITGSLQIKKQNIKRWRETDYPSHKSNKSESLAGFVLKPIPIDLSHYRYTKEQTKSLSQSSTTGTDVKEKDKGGKLSDSLGEEQTSEKLLNKNLSSKNYVQQLTQNLRNNLKIEESTNSHILLEPNYTLTAGAYIYDNSIRVVKFLAEGAQAKLYLGHIEEIDKLVAIKRYNIVKYDQSLADKITLECDILKSLDHDNIIKYFDVEFNYNDILEVRFYLTFSVIVLIL